MLRIGIVNGTEKGFTEEELQVTNDLPFGLVCMHAGVGRLGGESKYSTIITCEEAVERFALVLDIMPLWDKDSFPYKWLTDLDNIKRLEEHGWTCNVGNESMDGFMHKMKQILFDITMRERDEQFTHLHDRHSPSWQDLQEQKKSVRALVGNILSGYEDELDYSIQAIVEDFGLNNTQYGDKYIVYSEGEDRYKMQKEKPEEETWDD